MARKLSIALVLPDSASAVVEADSTPDREIFALTLAPKRQTVTVKLTPRTARALATGIRATASLIGADHK